MKIELLLAAAALFSTSIAKAADAAPKAEELEAKFRQSLTAVTLTGHWSPLKDGVLGAEKEDRYAIVSVQKTGGDAWVIHARLRYRQQEFTVPIPVQVKWAGDTAVILVDKMVLSGPGYGGTAYSARLLIHENTYAGTWSGGDHGGLMSGVIVKEAAAAEKK